MQLNSIILGRKAITFVALYNRESEDPHNATEERKVVAPEAPLPELNTDFAALSPVICRIMEFPKEYATGMSVFKMAISRTKQGTRSVAFKFKKALDAIGGEMHTLETPFIRIEKPADGESGRMEVTPDEQDLIYEAMAEAMRYAEGDRSQAILSLEDAKAKEGLNALADKGRDEEDGELGLND